MRASTVFARLSAILIVTALVNRVASGIDRSDLEKTLFVLHKLQRPDLGLVTPGRSGSVSESKDSRSQIRNPQYTTLRQRRHSDCEMNASISRSRRYWRGEAMDCGMKHLPSKGPQEQFPKFHPPQSILSPRANHAN
jgi:hypothetical protein